MLEREYDIGKSKIIHVWETSTWVFLPQHKRFDLEMTVLVFQE